MSVPFNTQDYTRLLKLAQDISESPRQANISIYISENNSRNEDHYISLEIKGHLSSDTIDRLYKLQQTSVDEKDLTL